MPQKRNLFSEMSPGPNTPHDKKRKALPAAETSETTEPESPGKDPGEKPKVKEGERKKLHYGKKKKT